MLDPISRLLSLHSVDPNHQIKVCSVKILAQFI